VAKKKGVSAVVNRRVPVPVEGSILEAPTDALDRLAAKKHRATLSKFDPGTPYTEHRLIDADGTYVIILDLEQIAPGRKLRDGVKIEKPQRNPESDYFHDVYCNSFFAGDEDLGHWLFHDTKKSLGEIFGTLAYWGGLDYARAEFQGVLDQFNPKPITDVKVLKKYVETKGNKTQTAKALGLDVRHVRSVIAKYRGKKVHIYPPAK
jgi:hypothetical protein